MSVAKLNLSEENEKVYDNLVVSVEASDGVLSLLLAVCDDLRLRERIIDRYEAELRPEIRPYRTVLMRKEPSLRQAIASVFEEDEEDSSYLSSGGRAVFTVTGAEYLVAERLGEERSEKEVFFGYLQWTREGMRAFPYPIILWLTNPLLKELSRKAPDFWSWRKAVLRFSSQDMQDVAGDDERAIAPLNSSASNLLRLPVKTLFQPEAIEENSLPLEELRKLTIQTEQRQAQRPNNRILATLYSRLGRAYASRVEPEDIDASQPELHEAIEWFEKAVRVQEALGTVVDLAKSLSWLGYLHQCLGNHSEAVNFLEQALTILEQQPDADSLILANTRHNLSVSYSLQGRDSEAVALLEEIESNIPQNLPRSGKVRFLGREEELSKLHAFLEDNRLAIASGMGGVGKTELALQYGHRYLENYSGGICWINARQDVGMQIISFASMFLDLAPPENWDVTQQVLWCWSNWQRGNVLVVFDDVTDYRSLRPFLPPEESRFHVLITTRLQRERPANELVLDVLSEREALELLRSLVGSDRLDRQLEDARALCAWLGYLPLALELVGQYLNLRADLAIAKLLERLETQGLAARALRRPDLGMTSALGIVAAFELSWKQLDVSAQCLAKLLSLFAIAPIRWEWVERCLPEVDSEDLETWRDDALVSSSLLERQEEGSYQLHPLVQTFLRQKLEESPQSEELKQIFVASMVEEAKQVKYPATIQILKAVAPTIPHIAEAATIWQDSLTDEELVIPFQSLGGFYEGQVDYPEAERWYKRCLEVARNRLGSEHPNLATSLNNLANLYRDQGRYTEAESLLLEALAIARQSLPPNHPSLAVTLSNLAQLYHSQEKYTEAEPLFQQALEILNRVLPPNDTRIATVQDNLERVRQQMQE